MPPAGAQHGTIVARMIELYPQIKLIHIVAVLSSGALFFVRGLAVQLGARWPMVAPLRYLSYAIDTVLLAAGVTLSIMLHMYPFVQHWLTAKILLLVVYIVLGSLALKRGRTQAIRRATWVAAVLVYLLIISIARTHNPLGIFARLGG